MARVVSSSSQDMSQPTSTTCPSATLSTPHGGPLYRSVQRPRPIPRPTRSNEESSGYFGRSAKSDWFCNACRRPRDQCDCICAIS